MRDQTDAAKILRDPAHVYMVNVDTISATVKQEFAAKEKGKAMKKPAPKLASKPTKKAAASPPTNKIPSRSQQERLRIFLLLAVCPPSRDAPKEHRGDILHPPDGQRGPIGRQNLI
ncbi:MAG TPA: hypothetical protein VMA34_06000 [Terracidiphilus sp.]|nr:hypothetical protein [Terracidiphilus sp.]